MIFRYSLRKMVKLFANSEDPDQTPRSVLYAKVSDKTAYANCVDPDQIAPATVCHSTYYLKKQLHKKTKFKPKKNEIGV